MKRLSILLVLVLVTGLAIAQPRGPRFTPEQQIARLDSVLQLTPEQRPQVLALLTQQAEQREARREAMRGQQARVQMGPGAMDAQLNALLTPEQRERLAAYRAQMQPMRRGGRATGEGGSAMRQNPDRRAMAQGYRMGQRDARMQMHATRQQMQARQAALQNVLTPEQQQRWQAWQAERNAAMEAQRANRQQFREQFGPEAMRAFMDELLTDEQKAQLREQMSQQGPRRGNRMQNR